MKEDNKLFVNVDCNNIKEYLIKSEEISYTTDKNADVMIIDDLSKFKNNCDVYKNKITILLCAYDTCACAYACTGNNVYVAHDIKEVNEILEFTLKSKDVMLSVYESEYNCDDTEVVDIENVIYSYEYKD